MVDLQPFSTYHELSDSHQPPAPATPFEKLRAGRTDPRGIRYIKPDPGLSTFNLEVSWGGGWIDLNDQENFRVGAATMENTAVTWRKIEAESPITEGSYIVHAVKAMVVERLSIYVYGVDQWQMNENLAKLEELFSRLDYTIRVTFDYYREYWRCQTAEWTSQRSQVYVHNVMTLYECQVPRFPTVTRELVS